MITVCFNTKEKNMSLSSLATFTILPEYSSWHLCSDAENRLLQAIEEQTVVLVNGILLVKFVGKMSGLALSSATCEKGMVVAGNWYAPIDHREDLKMACDRGEKTFHCTERTRWTFIRQLNEANASASTSLLTIATRCAEACTLASPSPLVGEEARQLTRKTWSEGF